MVALATLSSPFLAPQRAVVALLLASAVGSAGHATSDWAMFRGPNGQGIAEVGALPTEIGPEKALIWRLEIPPGSSSPVLFGDRIYLTGYDGDDLLVLAIDVSGQEAWRKTVPRTRHEKLDNRNDPASPSVAVDERGVVAFFGDFGLIAYDHQGQEQWRKALGPFNNLYGVGASPVIHGDMVVLSVDQQQGSFLKAFSRSSGETVWETRRPEAKTGHSTPILYEPEGGKPQLILPGSFFLTGYDLATGRKLWWVHGLSFEMKSVPVIGAGHIFINGYGSQFNDPDKSVATMEWAEAIRKSDENADGQISEDELAHDQFAHGWFGFNDLNQDGRLSEVEWQYFRDALATRNNMMAVRLPLADERGDLTGTHISWQYFRNVPQLPSPVLYRGVLWMISDRGIATTFEPRTGMIINQGRIAGGAESYYASPIAADGKIWLAARSGLVSVMPADGHLEPLHQVELDETITATPALAPGRLYVRTNKALWAFASAPAEGSN